MQTEKIKEICVKNKVSANKFSTVTLGKKVVIDNPLYKKLIKEGVRILTDSELLEILIGKAKNTKEKNTVQDPFSNSLNLADHVVDLTDQYNADFTFEQLRKIKGLSTKKSAELLAGMEFSRRRFVKEGIKIKEPKDVIPLIQHFATRKQETFISISLSGGNEVIAVRVVTIGLVNLCQVHPREVFADPLTDRACSVIVAHNHPSGDLTPSEADINVTNRLKEAAQILGIRLLDHIIFSLRGFSSIIDK